GRVLAALLAFAVFAVSGLGAWWSLSRVGRVNGHHSTVSPSPGPTAPFVFRGTLIVTGRPVGTNQGHHLYVVPQDGRIRQLNNQADIGSWSPDGFHIAATRVTSEYPTGELITIDTRNGHESLVTTFDVPFQAAWSPRGDLIA